MCDIVTLGIYPGAAFKQVRYVFWTCGIAPCLTRGHQGGSIDIKICEVYYVYHSA